MIYISGTITKIGMMKAMAIFNSTELKLKEQGYEVVNPCLTNSTLPKLDHDGYMVVSMAMLSLCNTIYMLKGWEDSDGAKEELQYALEHGYDVILEE
jgi:hypothetical protein